MNDAEAIVRDLAARDPIVSTGGRDWYDFICVDCPEDHEGSGPVEDEAEIRHAGNCLHRRACEWVAAHPEGKPSDPPQPVGYVWWSTQGIQWGGPEGTGHRTEQPVYLAPPPSDPPHPFG